jgi:NAD(P)-dependent dehydrogenase (short-subunit alcohol dehydrogenase family)
MAAHTARTLHGAVAVVTGSSRGLGKGIAVELGRRGATVYVTGRTAAAGPHALPGTIHQTADLHRPGRSCSARGPGRDPANGRGGHRGGSGPAVRLR